MIAVSVLQRCFADDRVGVCARCQRLVYFRPHTPPVARRICLECWVATGAKGTIVTTEASLRELALYLAPTTGCH